MNIFQFESDSVKPISCIRIQWYNDDDDNHNHNNNNNNNNNDNNSSNNDNNNNSNDNNGIKGIRRRPKTGV